ncbi:SH3-like domain-containing protein [Oceaniglobus roseus]|uniref:SH3-like domain-containing protein n=1 Tax=Oceaniglobus roseus TaxID=1737570 RepID=UPI000C7F710B|nr:SH3-like domain-containing protein [Kandeliimicrobium roseum]
MDRFDGKSWHDMGGGEGGALTDLPPDHDFALWEKRVDALMVLMTSKGHFSVDGLRRVLEDMGPRAFETMSYYERWMAAVNQNLVEAGLYTTTELGERMERVARRGGTYGLAADPRSTDRD